jgi:hypothetical protein
MATTSESLGCPEDEYFDVDDPWLAQDAIDDELGQHQTRHEEAFIGFSPDADFDDVLRANARLAARYLDCRKRPLSFSNDDKEMLELNGQAMTGFNGKWAKAADFTEIEFIDPRANHANIGGTVLRLVDPDDLEVE